MRLPNAQRAHVEEEKITGYLLSPSHRDGRSKADFFSRFGFRIGQWEEFAEALCAHGAAHEVVEVEQTSFGIKYVVIGAIETPDGRNPRVKTVWLVDRGSDHPKFITAHPVH